MDEKGEFDSRAGVNLARMLSGIVGAVALDVGLILRMREEASERPS